MEERMDHSFLTTMVGKEVKAYKGGPESWHGLLLAVKPDFIMIFNEKDGFIYYKTKHIKNVIVDSKTNTQGFNSFDSDGEEQDSFQEILENLINETIKINRGGPASRKGILLAVTTDFLVLYDEKEGVVYYNLEHIKSVSVKVDEKGRSTEPQDENNEEKEEELENGKTVHFINVNEFNQLFEEMKYSFVIINRGPESAEGILVDTSDGLLTLVVREEVLRVSQFHVKSIRQKLKTESSEDNNGNNNENNNQSDESSIVAAKKRLQDRKKGR
ncbi:MAG TPA: hypothetical protein GX497_04290 [Bacillus bacterium]|nr:hypothetical protein [Bacillus sp. (in: firmicutes)]